MADNDQKKSSVFSKIIEVGEAMLEAQIHKAKTSINANSNNSEDPDNFLYSKAITEDPFYTQSSHGWKDKPYRITTTHLKQMSLQDSVVAAVIQTRQNQVAAHSKLVDSEQEKGFIVKLKDEKKLLEEIKEELRLGNSEDMTKAGEQDPVLDSSPEDMTDSHKDDKTDDEVEKIDWELERKAREKLDKKFEKARKNVEDFILNCGILENRPFETRKWDFDSALRAWVRDSLTYDIYSTEIVRDNAGRPHHWFPIDSNTIKFASNQLASYRNIADNFMNLDILYPEKQAEAMEKQGTLELDAEKLENNEYKFVQVIRGKIERAYTVDELKMGIRNANTDIYNNGYGISELELLVSLVTGHLNAEFYNQAYFIQGFAAKGILHIKAAINRRKLETVRQQWAHMIKGTRNSFQTPIFAGVDDVQWIPLTQNHTDIGFEGWMRYLIRLICAIYQIDPQEIGINLSSEGKSGGINSGDSTKEKQEISHDKGLYPLLRHVEKYINDSIIHPLDDRFELHFCGITGENRVQTLARQKDESLFKKTVNEIRAEDGLTPLPGMDDIILSPVYMQWYTAFSDKGQEKSAKDQKHQANLNTQPGQGQPEEKDPNEGINPDGVYNPDYFNQVATGAETDETGKVKKSLKSSKKLKVEYYKIED